MATLTKWQEAIFQDGLSIKGTGLITLFFMMCENLKDYCYQLMPNPKLIRWLSRLLPTVVVESFCVV